MHSIAMKRLNKAVDHLGMWVRYPQKCISPLPSLVHISNFQAASASREYLYLLSSVLVANRSLYGDATNTVPAPASSAQPGVPTILS